MQLRQQYIGNRIAGMTDFWVFLLIFIGIWTFFANYDV